MTTLHQNRLTWEQAFVTAWSRPMGWKAYCLLGALVVALTLNLRHVLLPWLESTDAVGGDPSLSWVWEFAFLVGASFPIILLHVIAVRWILRPQNVKQASRYRLLPWIWAFFLMKTPPVATTLGLMAGLGLTIAYLLAWVPYIDDWTEGSVVATAGLGFALLVSAHVTAIITRVLRGPIQERV